MVLAPRFAVGWYGAGVGIGGCPAVGPVVVVLLLCVEAFGALGLAEFVSETRVRVERVIFAVGSPIVGMEEFEKDGELVAVKIKGGGKERRGVELALLAFWLVVVGFVDAWLGFGGGSGIAIVVAAKPIPSGPMLMVWPFVVMLTGVLEGEKE